jgi:hypothetical protein
MEVLGTSCGLGEKHKNCCSTKGAVNRGILGTTDLYQKVNKPNETCRMESSITKIKENIVQAIG